MAVKFLDNRKCKLTLLDSVLSSVHSTCGFRAKNEFNDLNKGNKLLKGKFIWEIK